MDDLKFPFQNTMMNVRMLPMVPTTTIIPMTSVQSIEGYEHWCKGDESASLFDIFHEIPRDVCLFGHINRRYPLTAIQDARQAGLQRVYTPMCHGCLLHHK